MARSSIFKCDLFFSYGDLYTAYHYMHLFEQLLQLVSQKKTIEFLLPGFPAKSPNNVRKVFSFHADYTEYIALKSFVQTIRKVCGTWTILVQ